MSHIAQSSKPHRIKARTADAVLYPDPKQCMDLISINLRKNKTKIL
jgi:hypothetical protein